MTNIQFLFNVSDKDAIIYKIVKSNFNKNRSCLIYFDNDSAISNFSQILWSKDTCSFYPHQIKETEKDNRICLSSDPQLMDDILINGTNQTIKYFSRYQKFYELVGTQESDKADARERFLFYKDCGYKLEAVNSSAF